MRSGMCARAWAHSQAHSRERNAARRGSLSVPNQASFVGATSDPVNFGSAAIGGESGSSGAAGAKSEVLPGLLQLHCYDPASIALPVGVALDSLSAPDANVLLPLAL